VSPRSQPADRVAELTHVIIRETIPLSQPCLLSSLPTLWWTPLAAASPPSAKPLLKVGRKPAPTTCLQDVVSDFQIHEQAQFYPLIEMPAHRTY
jgi:hypothetical protein